MEDLKVTENPDGTATVAEPAPAVAPQQDFYANLAEGALSDFDLNSLASDLLELIEKDEKAREKRDKQQEEGIRRSGAGEDAPGGAEFDGASRTVHPMLAEGCIDFSARAIKELFPAHGPVKTKIISRDDLQTLDRAKRKRDFLNWQLTTKIREYRAELEQLLTQLPLGGSQYMKFWYDPDLERICTEFVPIDEVFLPYAATSFYTAPRSTHRQSVTRHKFEQRVASGFYRDIQLIPEGTEPEPTASGAASDKVEGREETGYNEDGLRIIYETRCWRELEGDDRPRPYIVHTDKSSQKILAVYRNWEEGDPKFQEVDWWVEDKFIPWRGAYGIGLWHLIGSLSVSATGAVRALLDAAHINNSPGALKLKGARASGETIQINQTEIKEIEAPSGIDDIRKVVMPLPFNPPSAVLFNLLEWLTEKARGVVATAEEKIAEASNTMPVGTALALIEQGSQVFSSIHSRLHASQAQALKIICRLNKRHPDQQGLQKFGLRPEDFDENDDIEPVSDPNIFSESQRYAQLQESYKLRQLHPNLKWNDEAMARRSLELLRINYADEILPRPPEPVASDPVTENVAAIKGAQLKVLTEQDHPSHIKAHLVFINSPWFQLDPSPMPQLAALYTHVQDHLLSYYEQTCMQAIPAAQQQLIASGEPYDPDRLSVMASNVSESHMQQVTQLLGGLMQQAAQVVQAKTPQPPTDPAVQKTFEAAMAEIERKKQYDAEKLKLERSVAADKSAAEERGAGIDATLRHMQQTFDQRLEEIRNAAQAQSEKLRAQVELIKNDADNRQHQMTELLKNRDDNNTSYLIAQLKESIAATAPKQEPNPQNDAMLRQMQDMLGRIESAKTGDALTTAIEALRQTMAGSQAHQERMAGLAQSLLSQQ